MIAERILIVHNAYQHRGGEDSVVESEIALLRSHGHTVDTYLRSNDDVTGLSPMTLARDTLWSSRTAKAIRARIMAFRPDVIHAHNTFPLVSPSLYWAADRAGVPVVQTLHNFRLLCLNALFLRNGLVCEDCMGRLPWRGVARACYRDSFPASAALAGMLALHRGLGTYRNKVACYIALNEFCRRKFVEGGLPGEKIVVKPNFVDWGSLPETLLNQTARQGLLFVGRLSAEKGVATMADGMRLLSGVELRVVGEGPDAGLLDAMENVARLGKLPSDGVRAEMHRAMALIVPSVWYETFGLVIAEAYACGLPVIASRIGALVDIVREGETGLLFEPGNADDLAQKIRWAYAHPEAMAAMGQRALERFQAEFSAEINYRFLLDIYRCASSRRSAES